MKFTKDTSECQNYGSTIADLVVRLINDRDELQVILRKKENRIIEIQEASETKIKALEESLDYAYDKAFENKDFIHHIFVSLDSIVDAIPYNNRTKKENYTMILSVMDEITDYLNKE